MSKYTFQPISLEEVNIIKKWVYSGYINTLYMEPYITNYDPLAKTTKGPDNCDGYAVYKGQTLFGLFEVYWKNDVLEIGLAINPTQTNQGHSTSFIHACIDFAVSHYSYKKNFIQLHVEKDNIAAYKAYLKADFITQKTVKNEYLMYYYL